MPRLLVVTGMHRSGTSLVAQLLQALGWDVGPTADLMPAKPDNPRGFVEHLPAVRVNDHLLHRLGGSWHRPPALPPGWADDEALDDLRARAAGVVEPLLARDTDRLLLKDPRFSLTLPFWRTVVDVHRVLLVVRPPTDVVASLVRRDDGLDRAAAARLWTRYLLAGLRAAPAAHVTSTETLLGDPTARLPALAAALGHAPTSADVGAAAALVEDELWGRSARAERTDEAPAPPDLAHARLLHAAVTGEDGAAWRAALGTLATLEEVAATEHAASARLAAVRGQLQEAQDRLPRLREQAAQAHERAERIRAERDTAREQHDRLRERLEATRARGDAAQAPEPGH